MTKRELIERLEQLDVPDSTPCYSPAGQDLRSAVPHKAYIATIGGTWHTEVIASHPGECHTGIII